MSDQPNVSRFIGKTLAEVKAMHSQVRVVRAGKVSFPGIRDFRPTRLNVKLGEEGITFEESVRVHDGIEYKNYTVKGSMDNGIVLEAHYG